MRTLHYLENRLVDDQVVIVPKWSESDPDSTVHQWSDAITSFRNRQDRAQRDRAYVLPEIDEEAAGHLDFCLASAILHDRMLTRNIKRGTICADTWLDGVQYVLLETRLDGYATCPAFVMFYRDREERMFSAVRRVVLFYTPVTGHRRTRQRQQAIGLMFDRLAEDD